MYCGFLYVVRYGTTISKLQLYLLFHINRSTQSLWNLLRRSKTAVIYINLRLSCIRHIQYLGDFIEFDVYICVHVYTHSVGLRWVCNWCGMCLCVWWTDIGISVGDVGGGGEEGSEWGTEERKIITTAAVDTRFNETLPTHPLFFHSHTYTQPNTQTHKHTYTHTYTFVRYRIPSYIPPLPPPPPPRLSALEVIRICRIRFLIVLARRGICPKRPGNPALMNARDNGLNPFGSLAIIPAQYIYTSLFHSRTHT